MRNNFGDGPLSVAFQRHGRMPQSLYDHDGIYQFPAALKHTADGVEDFS
jgi:hypothetical protein